MVEDSTVVIALGGHALATAQDGAQLDAEQVRSMAEGLEELVAQKRPIVLVHGNGPQVGSVLRRAEAVNEKTEALDVMVAKTQGSIGYGLCQLLDRFLGGRGLASSALLTRVLVDKDDPEFGNPSKPIGRYYSEEEKEELAEQLGHRMVFETNRGWRRVVASPRPLSIVEMEAIRKLSCPERILVAGGGGGVAVAGGADGLPSGIEAVVDKDRTATLLALRLEAGLLINLTGVPCVYRGFGGTEQSALPSMTPAEAKELGQAGELPEGSMGPKVRAATEFVEQSGRQALITDPRRLGDALRGAGVGTWILP